MDSNFTFPRPQAPTPRSAPSSSSPTSSTGAAAPVKRESNALRASVLDAALELGIGTNSTVANWMFNNALSEEEEEDQPSPALTYGSTATSDESPISGRFPSTSSSSHVSSNLKSAQPPDKNIFPVPEGHIRFDTSVDMPTRPSAGVTQGFPDIPIPPRPVTPITPTRGKLRKKRGDGYESDGGYMSDVGKKKDKDKKKGGVKETAGGMDVEADKKERAKEAKIRAKEEKLREKKEKEEEKKRKKSMGRSKKGDTEDKDGYTTGYETDSTPAKGSKSKSKSKPSGDAGYETDSGYLSSTSGKSKSRSRFFSLGSKQSKANLRQEEIPAMPTLVIPKEPVSLPIASRFASAVAPPPPSLPVSVSTPLGHSSPTSTDPPHMPPLVTSPSLPAFATAPLYSSTSPTVFRTANRESGDSAESGGSVSRSSSTSHSKRQGVQFFRPESSHGHGNGSYSTITSASQVPLPQSAATSPVSPTREFPSISLPLTHTTSSSPTRKGYPLPDSYAVPSSRQQSPPNSPDALSPPVIPTSRNPSPAPGLKVPGSQFLQATSPSPTSSAAPSPRLRPRFAPTDGFGPRTTPSLSPNPSPSPVPRSPSPLLRSPSRQAADRPALTIIPSSAYIVPSPHASPGLPAPNVLAYYDIPPPSPPPAGPLPSVPPLRSVAPTGTQSRTQDRPGGGSVGSIAQSRTPEQGLYTQAIPSIQRGREAPFPARPILPSAMQAGVGQGLEARVKVPRYRELYGLPLPPGQADHSRAERTSMMRDWDSHSEAGPAIDVVEPSDGGWEDLGYDDQDEEDMRDVLDRFEEARVGSRAQQQQGGKALGRSHSFEAIRNRLSGNSDSEDHYEDEGEEATGRKSSTEEGGGDRNSRWSGSIYSRVSVLDPEKSEEARQRFVQRVEDMYGDGGREKVPPVPKIPDGFVGAAPGRSWNRF
ncbi:hypothetical protein FPV67DRAFT_1672502 [Lyophyllum atratum]|nr:hypothetical protein FPV67DRAFT_1672502 [Lyophyllum atratum]